MNAQLTKCKCRHCNQNIEFDSDDAGQTIPCPHCNLETMLFIAPEIPRPAPLQKRHTAAVVPISTLVQCGDCQKNISKRAVVCPGCGVIPSLWRVGWYVLCIMGAMGIISGIVSFAIWAVNDCMKSM